MIYQTEMYDNIIAIFKDDGVTKIGWYEKMNDNLYVVHLDDRPAVKLESIDAVKTYCDTGGEFQQNLF